MNKIERFMGSNTLTACYIRVYAKTIEFNGMFACSDPNQKWLYPDNYAICALWTSKQRKKSVDLSTRLKVDMDYTLVAVVTMARNGQRERSNRHKTCNSKCIFGIRLCGKTRQRFRGAEAKVQLKSESCRLAPWMHRVNQSKPKNLLIAFDNGEGR